MYNQNYAIQPQQDEQSYKQELGLKKILYKYEHQNQQLKTQIKALTERLQDIISKKDNQKNQKGKQPIDSMQQYRFNLLKQQMKSLFAQIEKVTHEIKAHKDLINQTQQQKCAVLENQIKNEDLQISQLKKKLIKYQKLQQNVKNFDQKNSQVRISAHAEKLKALQTQLQEIKKNIRELERFRDQNDRKDLKKHHQVVSLAVKTRKLSLNGKESSANYQEQEPKKRGVWHMEYTQENYQNIKKEIANLRAEKDRIIESVKNQNLILKKRLEELTNQEDQLNKSINISQLQPIKTPLSSKINKTIDIQNPNIISPVKQSFLNVGPKQFQRHNDKNFSPKKLRKMQWQSTQSRAGLQWCDTHLKSPITGMNMWMDGYLVGIQMLHTFGESSQHMHLVGKNIMPIQYRLSNNDYVQNVILYINQNKIVGIEFTSKNGRNDSFGNKAKGKKFDFQIKAPQKPVISYGKFKINNNVSEISKLGFEII